jgi:hypothetical protein
LHALQGSVALEQKAQDEVNQVFICCRLGTLLGRKWSGGDCLQGLSRVCR